MTFAILCTGPSMSQAVADSVRHLRVIAVNKAFELAPSAEALAANDHAFWRTYPDAHQFAGRKFSASTIKGVEKVHGAQSCWSSGCLALHVAKQLGAKRILLLGMDFRGGHYFGEYVGACKRSAETKWQMHRVQFARWRAANRRIEVLNCTPGSALDVFSMANLSDCLHDGIREHRSAA